jgi:hypothetical protein
VGEFGGGLVARGIEDSTEYVVGAVEDGGEDVRHVELTRGDSRGECVHHLVEQRFGLLGQRVRRCLVDAGELVRERLFVGVLRHRWSFRVGRGAPLVLPASGWLWVRSSL